MEGLMAERQIPEPPTPEQYRDERLDIAMAFAPRIYPCSRCKWPRADGYVCHTCGADE